MLEQHPLGDRGDDLRRGEFGTIETADDENRGARVRVVAVRSQGEGVDRSPLVTRRDRLETDLPGMGGRQCGQTGFENRVVGVSVEEGAGRGGGGCRRRDQESGGDRRDGIGVHARVVAEAADDG